MDEYNIDELLNEKPDYSSVQNVCAHCGSKEIEFEDQEMGADYIEFMYQCQDCGEFGKLKYSIEFDKNEKE